MKFFEGLERLGDQIALITAGETVSYRELAARVERTASLLESGRLAFLLLHNHPDSVAAYLACLRAGVVPLLLHPGMDRALLSQLYQTYRPNYAFVPPEADGLPMTGTPLAENDAGVWLRLEAGGSPELHPQLAILLSTSGSTGSQKLVRLTAANLDSNARAIAQYLDITPEERAITSLPFSYAFGLSVINSHLAQGASLVLTDASITESAFWQLFREQRVTSLSGVPYTFEILRKLRFERMNLPHLRYLAQAGGRLRPEWTLEMVQLAQRKGYRYWTMYGQTEATARMAYLPWEQAQAKNGSIGVAIPGGSLFLDGEELIYRGPNVSWGYAQTAEDLARGDDNQGVLRTGDLAQQDAEGFFSIIGRKKRFLKLFGYRIGLEEVETLLAGEGYEAACSGVDDQLRIYLTGPFEAEKVRHFLQRVAGIPPSGVSLVGIDEIPRNAAGKVLFSALESHG